MYNLLNSTEIAMVFLDSDLKVMRFTDKIGEIVTLRKTDIGRPISELVSHLPETDLVAECSEVLKTLAFRQGEVQTMDRHWHLMRVMPYRTADNVIEGVVVTFVNIDRLKETEALGAHAIQYFGGIVDTIREPLIVLNGELRVVSANRSFYRVFQTTARQAEGELIYELGAGQWDMPKLRVLLEEILPKNTSFDDFRVEVDLPRVGHRRFALNARRLEQAGDTENLVLLVLEDITSTDRPE